MTTNDGFFLKKGIFYVFVANVINMIISLFSGFVLPKFLSIETYADIKLFQLYITYIGILHLGFSDGMYLRLGGKSLDNIDKKEVYKEFSTFKLFQLFVSFIAIIISVLLKNSVLIAISIVILPINISNYIRNLYNASGQFRRYSFYTNINTILLFLLNLTLLFIIKTNNSNTYLISYVIMYLVYWLFVEYENSKIFGRGKLCFEKKYFIEDIKSGFVLMFGNFCNVIFTSIDRIFVQYLLGKIKFAYYSFAVSIENLLNVFITPISTVMFNYFCNNKEKEKVIKVKKNVMIFAIFVISLIFGAKFIVEFWLKEYKNSLVILFLLVAAQYISIIIRCIHINLYKAFKQQNRYFFIMVIIVILSLILNTIGYFLLKNEISIAIATFITNIIWFVVGEIEFKKFRLNFKDYLLIFLEVCIFLICGLCFNSISGFIIYIIFSIILNIVFEKKDFFEIIKTLFKVLKK